MWNLSQLGKVEFDLKLSNLIDSDVASHRQLILELKSAIVKFDVWTGPKRFILPHVRQIREDSNFENTDLGRHASYMYL